jgi:hypothetical protein
LASEFSSNFKISWKVFTSKSFKASANASMKSSFKQVS